MQCTPAQPPIPVWTGNRTRHRLNRSGNRQLNTALHRIAVTQLRVHPSAKALVERRVSLGNSRTEALRVCAATLPTSSTIGSGWPRQQASCPRLDIGDS
ncbi:transposase [Catellatospora sp. NPDC049609]|uniref:transposase n=1 Tax=Catellatospora sp. NPDC049609 TaxID=3155505 RepID=UPI0034234345